MWLCSPVLVIGLQEDLLLGCLHEEAEASRLVACRMHQGAVCQHDDATRGLVIDLCVVPQLRPDQLEPAPTPLFEHRGALLVEEAGLAHVAS